MGLVFAADDVMMKKIKIYRNTAAYKMLYDTFTFIVEQKSKQNSSGSTFLSYSTHEEWLYEVYGIICFSHFMDSLGYYYEIEIVNEDKWFMTLLQRC